MSQLGPGGLVDCLEGEVAEAVDSMVVTVEDGKAKTYIKCNRELTNEEIEKIKEYLTWQFSDGWGEEFETGYSFAQNIAEVEEYDEELKRPTYHKIETELFACFWNNKGFYVDIKRV